MQDELADFVTAFLSVLVQDYVKDSQVRQLHLAELSEEGRPGPSEDEVDEDMFQVMCALWPVAVALARPDVLRRLRGLANQVSLAGSRTTMCPPYRLRLRLRLFCC